MSLRYNPAMLKLATVLDNPGEPMAETRYRDPAELRALGYNGVVLYETTALSGINRLDSVPVGEMRDWIARQFELVHTALQRIRAAGLAVYLSYDVLCLPRHLFESRRDELACRNHPRTVCPAGDEVLRLSLDALAALVKRFAPIDGIVLRFGDTDADRLPHLAGNDIYQPHCARCSRLGRADRICRIVEAFHRCVVGELGLTLIARAWNVRPNGLHDSQELCRRVHERLPQDDKLILSFKFTQTDFWRYQSWNPSSLVCGNRPIIYELECQREYEGKGAVPNWQAPLWRDGPPEVASEVQGLRGVRSRVRLAGLWSWVRGGGWGGPFVAEEAWIDANAFAVPRLADEPDVSLDGLARDWARQRLHLGEPELIDAVTAVLAHSPQTALEGFYIGPLARSRPSPWHPSADWIQDDLVNAHAAQRIIEGLSDAELGAVIAEKHAAAERLGKDRLLLRQAAGTADRARIEPLLNTMEYGEALFNALRDFLAGLVEYRRYRQTHSPEQARQCCRLLLNAQSHWNHHTQRTASLPGAATAFCETGFWDLTQQILGELSV